MARSGWVSEMITCDAPARLRMAQAAIPTGPPPRMTARSPGCSAAAAFDDRVVSHRGRFHQTASDEDIIALVVLAQWLQAPERARGQDDIGGIGSIDVEADLVQLFAVVGLTVGARFALPAPQHFFGGDRFAALERLVGALVAGVLTGFHHHAGEFVPEDGGETGQSGIVNIAFLIRLGHVHIRAADSAGLHLHEHFLRTRGGDVVFTDLQPWVAPDLAAQVSLAAFDILGTELETGLGIPVCDQCHALHFAFHNGSPFLGFNTSLSLDYQA